MEDQCNQIGPVQPKTFLLALVLRFLYNQEEDQCNETEDQCKQKLFLTFFDFF